MIEPHSLDLGEVWETPGHTHVIRVENRDRRPIRVEGFSFGCAALNSKPTQFELAPGAAREVELVFDLNLPDGGSKVPQPIRAPLYIAYSQPEMGAGKQRVGELCGVVKPALDTQPVWNLGVWSAGGGPNEKTFEVVSPLPLSDLSADPVSPSQGRFRVSSSCADPSLKVWRVAVRAEPLVSPGVLRTDITLRPTTTDKTTLPSRRVTAEAEVIGEFRISPTELDFGAVKVGEVASACIAVYSPSGRPARVEQAEPVGEGVEVTPEGAGVFRVKHRVDRPGPATATVRFSVRSGGGLERFILEVKATGIEPTSP